MYNVVSLNIFDQLLKKLAEEVTQDTKWIRASKENKLHNPDEFLIKMINKVHGDPYMMLGKTMNLYLIDLLHWGSQTLDMNLVGAQMDTHTHTPTKETKLYIEIFLVFWLVNKGK